MEILFRGGELENLKFFTVGKNGVEFCSIYSRIRIADLSGCNSLVQPFGRSRNYSVRRFGYVCCPTKWFVEPCHPLVHDMSFGSSTSVFVYATRARFKGLGHVHLHFAANGPRPAPRRAGTGGGGGVASPKRARKF